MPMPCRRALAPIGQTGGRQAALSEHPGGWHILMLDGGGEPGRKVAISTCTSTSSQSIIRPRTKPVCGLHRVSKQRVGSTAHFLRTRFQAGFLSFFLWKNISGTIYSSGASNALRAASRRRDHNRSPELKARFDWGPQREVEAAQKNIPETNRGFALKGESPVGQEGPR